MNTETQTKDTENQVTSTENQIMNTENQIMNTENQVTGTEHQTMAKRFFHQKVLTPFVAVLLIICGIAGTAACFWQPVAVPTNEQLFEAAMIDSMTVEDDELLPLVTITPESDMVTWRDDGKTLLLTFHYRPERYIAGEALILPSAVWTTSNKEMYRWYQQNKNGVTDWPLRFKQLLGVPPDRGYTHVSAMWVAPEDVRRPAYNTDITDTNMLVALPEDTPEEYREWFEDNIIWSYFDSDFPWTRLGYTYDWADKCDEYGLTEFLVHPDAEVMVEYTDTIDEFVMRMERETK